MVISDIQVLACSGPLDMIADAFISRENTSLLIGKSIGYRFNRHLYLWNVQVQCWQLSVFDYRILDELCVTTDTTTQAK